MTIVDTVADRHYGDKVKLALAFADLLNQEARALQADGVDMIQFDEPAFNVYMDDVADWGVEALHRAAAGLTCTTAVHICYGYGIKANIDWKASLGEEWRQYEKTFPALARSRIQQISLECTNSHVPPDLMAMLTGKDVMVGVIDVASDKVETPEEVADTIGTCVEVRAERAALRVHQLRHGADVARDRGGEAGSAGARRGTRAEEVRLRCSCHPERSEGSRSSKAEISRLRLGKHRQSDRFGDRLAHLDRPGLSTHIPRAWPVRAHVLDRAQDRGSSAFEALAIGARRIAEKLQHHRRAPDLPDRVGDALAPRCRARDREPARTATETCASD